MRVDFEQLDDDLLIHEIGHYLASIQGRFMSLSRHVFSKPWSDEGASTLLTSMIGETSSGN